MIGLFGEAMIFYGLSSTDQYLYHYTSADTLISKILPTGTLRMNPFAETNDPKESKDWIFGQWTEHSFDGVTDGHFKQIECDATVMAKAQTKLLCMTMDDALAVGFNIDGIWYRGFCRPRMWAQYGARHTGACLIFDKDQLSEAVKLSVGRSGEVFSGEVQYCDRPIVRSISDRPYILDFDMIKRSGVSNTVSQHIAEHRRELFFEKAVDWRDEREFRWIASGIADRYLHIEFGRALKGVIVGGDFDEGKGPRLWAYSRDQNWELGQLHWKNSVPEVEPRVWPSQRRSRWRWMPWWGRDWPSPPR
jgi:hypothetical protein